MEDAYYHRLLRREARKCLAFRCLGRYSVPVAMPFGLAPAPMTCKKVSGPVVQHPREAGLLILPNVVDFGGAPPALPGRAVTRAQAGSGYRYVERHFRELGLVMHPTKGVRDGPSCVWLLGHLVDTRFLFPQTAWRRSRPWRSDSLGALPNTGAGSAFRCCAASAGQPSPLPFPCRRHATTCAALLRPCS